MSFENLGLNSYSIVRNCNVTISLASSLLLESLAWDQKILQVDYSNGNQYCINHPDALWQINDNSYDAFERRLDKIFNLDLIEYKKIINDYKKHIMYFNEELPTYAIIQKEIKKLINAKK